MIDNTILIDFYLSLLCLYFAIELISIRRRKKEHGLKEDTNRLKIFTLKKAKIILKNNWLIGIRISNRLQNRSSTDRDSFLKEVEVVLG